MLFSAVSAPLPAPLHNTFTNKIYWRLWLGAGWVHYPLLLMLQFFFTNLTFLSGKISGDTQGVIQHPSGDVYYLESFNLDIDTLTKHNV